MQVLMKPTHYDLHRIGPVKARSFTPMTSVLTLIGESPRSGIRNVAHCEDKKFP